MIKSVLGFWNMDFPRIIQVFVVQGGLGLIYLFIAYKILRRESRGINLRLSGFYICGGIGAIINIIYVFMIDESIVKILHFFTYFILCFSLVFLLLTVLILDKSEKMISGKIQFLIIISFIIMFGVLWFIPEGITINSSTDWKPKWSWPFLIYSVIVCSVMLIIPTIYYSLKLYNKFEHQALKKKWKFFLIGIFTYFFLYYGTSISNTLADPLFRLIWSIISIFTLISLYFIYYAIVIEVWLYYQHNRKSFMIKLQLNRWTTILIIKINLKI